jgi:hypothetical protein
MNNAAACTERSPSKGNPLDMLQGVGGKIAHSLKRTVTTNAAKMFAGLSMLTAASSGTALATEVVLRDTIHDTPATTQNALWERGNQTPATHIPTVATYAVKLPANSVCKLSTISFVFGSASRMPAPDIYDWREIFNVGADGNRTTDLRLEVFDGPATNLVNRMSGDIYSRSVAKEEMSTTAPWGSTTNSYTSRAVTPYNQATLSFTNIAEIETGPEGKTVYVKVCFVKLQDKSTFGCLAEATGQPVDGDIALDSGTGLYEPSSGYAAKIMADVRPKDEIKPMPACGLEPYNGKLAVCWPASFGTNYVVGSTTNFSEWSPQPIEGVFTDAEKGKNYAVLLTNGAGTCFFRLESVPPVKSK